MSEVEFLPQWYVRKRRAAARIKIMAGAFVAAFLICLALWAVTRGA